MGELADSRELIQQLNVLVRGVEQRADRLTEGLRSSLLAVLEQRGALLTAGERDAIEVCVDGNQLQRWLARAIVGQAPELLREQS